MILLFIPFNNCSIYRFCISRFYSEWKETNNWVIISFYLRNFYCAKLSLASGLMVQKSIASPGRGILAIDESNATCGKRLASIGLDNTETNRQAYRQLLLTTPGLGEYISGAILFEETLYQSTTGGKKFVDCLLDENIVPGIKVDKVLGQKNMQNINRESGGFNLIWFLLS